jgi:hypothetical protein
MNLFAVEADVKDVFYHRANVEDMWTLDNRLKAYCTGGAIVIDYTIFIAAPKW